MRDKEGIMSLIDLYYFLVREYGERKCWISDIATMLNISKKEARILIQSLGYHRGKTTGVVSFKSFSVDKDVLTIQARL